MKHNSRPAPFPLSNGRRPGLPRRTLAFHCWTRNDRAPKRAQLADAMSVPVRALEDVQISFDSLTELPKEIPTDKARRELLLTRPDILASLAEYAASQSALQLEIAKQYPDIHLSPGYEFDQGDNKWSLGVGITLPIFNRNQGAIREAMAKRSEAAANFVALQVHAINETERALVSYRLALQKATEADSLRTSLLKQEKSLQAMRQAGDISKSDMIGLQLQLSASSLTRLDAIAKAQQAFGSLEDGLRQQEDGDARYLVWQSSRDRSDRSRRGRECIRSRRSIRVQFKW